MTSRRRSSSASASASTTRRSAATAARRLGPFVVPEGVVDAQSLVAFADLVISAGGTMNREAVALGTPVYTTFEGRLGAVDGALLHEGRMRRLTDAADVSLERRSEHAGLRIRRDPRGLVRLLLSAADS